MPEYVNQYGRRPGRGVRPWLLIPKVIGVAVYVGGMVAALAVSIALLPPHPGDVATAVSPAQWQPWIAALRGIIVFAAVPGLLLAAVCGMALLYLHGGPVWRMRWLRVKLAFLIVTIPVLHILANILLGKIRLAIAAPDTRQTSVLGLALMLQLVLAAAVAQGVIVIVLGRHKPRLGQSVAAITGKPAASSPARVAGAAASQESLTS